MLMEEIPPRPSSYSRVSLAIITEPGQANPFGTLHGGVILKLADECGGIAALRHAGKGQITTAAIDSMIFLSPVYVGERVEISAEVTYVGRTRSRPRSRSSPSRSRCQSGGKSPWAMRSMCPRRVGPASAAGPAPFDR